MDVRAAENLIVTKTSVGSAQPVAAALDGEGWPEAIGSIAGDDTILIICANKKAAKETREPHSGDACLMAAKLKTAVLGATGYSGVELVRLLARHPLVETPMLLSRPKDRIGEAESTSEFGGYVSGSVGKRWLSVAAAFMAVIETAGG